MPNEKLTIEDIAEFSWDFGHEFFLETSKGNFIWSDPDYQGDNTIVPFHGTFKLWIKEKGISTARDKGTHRIVDYCGPDVKIA